MTVTFTVTNIGTRATRQTRWDDRLYLSSDPSLDRTRPPGRVVAPHVGPLAAGASYTCTATFRIPSDADGRFYLIAFTDSNVVRRSSPAGAATIGVAQVQLDHDSVPGVQGRGQQHRRRADRRHARAGGRPAGDERDRARARAARPDTAGRPTRSPTPAARRRLPATSSGAIASTCPRTRCSTRPPTATSARSRTPASSRRTAAATPSAPSSGCRAT